MFLGNGMPYNAYYIFWNIEITGSGALQPMHLNVAAPTPLTRPLLLKALGADLSVNLLLRHDLLFAQAFEQ
jgi:hypothetical protein